MLSFEEKYEALVRKDPSYEGIFVTAVKTTMIFCRPTCTARKPKPENVVFYENVKDALVNGYRPCKVCKPMQPSGLVPDAIQGILQELNDDPYTKIKDGDLVDKGIEPSLIRRWFKKNHGMTFHAYQRMLRINNAFHQITNGDSVTHAAFDHGYESLSGFNDRYKSIFGMPPTRATNNSVINIVRFTTPLGPMFGCATNEGVCLVEFTDRKMLETEFKDLQKRLDAAILPGTNPHLEHLQKELAEYFAGKRRSFTVPLVTPGSTFQNQVWAALQEIPYGTTVSYAAQAVRLRKPKAVRAVAAANGMNRIAILIPCHRVIGSDGTLKGYGGGLARKRWLLEFERGAKSMSKPPLSTPSRDGAK
ncbi:MAG: bifunctional transcriptional activator/DNA repair enzyme AdaA [bacterium]